MFGEPAWDMLLVLYTEEGRERQTVGKLINAAGHAPTTAQRWLDYLETQGFVRREPHPVDPYARALSSWPTRATTLWTRTFLRHGL